MQATDFVVAKHDLAATKLINEFRGGTRVVAAPSRRVTAVL
jgi:hypothetical protein